MLNGKHPYKKDWYGNPPYVTIVHKNEVVATAATVSVCVQEGSLASAAPCAVSTNPAVLAPQQVGGHGAPETPLDSWLNSQEPSDDVEFGFGIEEDPELDQHTFFGLDC